MTSGVKNLNPTFSAHFLSVLEKSALPPGYFRPAASPTKKDADLSKRRELIQRYAPGVLPTYIYAFFPEYSLDFDPHSGHGFTILVLLCGSHDMEGNVFQLITVSLNPKYSTHGKSTNPTSDKWNHLLPGFESRCFDTLI